MKFWVGCWRLQLTLCLALAAEPPTDSTSEPEVAGKQEAREGDQAKPPPRAPKTVSSFFGECLPPISSQRRGEEAGGPFSGARPALPLPYGRPDPSLLA